MIDDNEQNKEMMAYASEILLEQILRKHADAETLRVPFLDKDGKKEIWKLILEREI